MSLPSGSTTPIQFKPSCFCPCTPMCAMRSNAGRGAIASSRHAHQLAAELVLDRGHELIDAHVVEHIFEARFQPVGPVTGFDEHPHDRVRDHRCVLRLDDDSGFLGEILVAGDSAAPQAKPDTGFGTETVLYLDG